MATKTTKRRKVWVTFDGYGLGAAYTNKAAAMERIRWSSRPKDPNEHEVAVPMVELRRGDVVLSREDVDKMRRWLEAVGQSTPRGTKHADCISQSLKLLRGGR